MSEPSSTSLSEDAMKAIIRWYTDGDVGLSSMVLASMAINHEPMDLDGPQDFGDFTRCAILVRKEPEVRVGFPKVKRLSNEWKVTLDHFDEMLELMDKAVPGWDTHGYFVFDKSAWFKFEGPRERFKQIRESMKQ